MSGSWKRVVRLVGVGAGVVFAAVAMSGCASLPGAGLGAGFDLSSGFLGLPSSEPGKPKSIAELKQAHLEKPQDPDAAISYSRALKSGGRGPEALAIVETVAGARPDDQRLVVEQGLLALELGQTAKAQHALLRASPSTKDWKVLSGLGVAHAGVGQHAKAQDYFNRALELSPGNPTVLNNLALSYLLDKKVDKGRELLAQASAAGGDKPQIARNLELATALKGGAKGGAVTGSGGGSAIAHVRPATGGTALAEAPAGSGSRGAQQKAVAQKSPTMDAPAKVNSVAAKATGHGKDANGPGAGEAGSAASASAPIAAPIATAAIEGASGSEASAVTAKRIEKSPRADVPPQILRFGGLLHDP